MYAYCVREFSKKNLYAKTKLFQCISKSKNASVFRSKASMNTCKTRSERPQVCECKCRNIISEGYGFENRDLGISCDFLEFLVISCNILKYLHHKAKKKHQN